MHDDIKKLLMVQAAADGDLIVRGKVCALSFPVIV
jgi:hypothetical protein